MTDRTITLTLPDDVYQRAQKIAQESAQSLETILANQLEMRLDDLGGLPYDEQAELVALAYLSNSALHTIADERFPQDLDERQQVLGDRNSRGTITPEEHAELEDLVEQGNRLMLRKAEAMAILTRRSQAL